MAKITLSNLAHRYAPGDNYALKPMNHVWDDGTAYALLGPSGCGKTTLLNIISGLLTPSDGSVLFNGDDVTKKDTASRNIAQVFQFPVVYDTMTVRDNLAFPLKNRKLDTDYIKRRVEEIADMTGLTDILDKKALSLTADVKQKISLGRGLVREDVNAILFDEPLTVIDPHMKWQLRTELKALHKKLGHTMIYVTHDQTEALTFADKVVVMLEGEVVQIGTPTELFEKPGHTFVGYFIGSPGMNILPVKIKGDKAYIANHEIALAQGYKDMTGKIEIGIRPEFITLSNNPSDLPITIKRIEDVGHYKIIRAAHKDIDINIIANEAFEFSEDLKYARFDKSRTNIYADDWLVEP
ncbi:MAG: ABC transporter ATP-binding protein [Emcibacteraceae bacterium]|nr:ABC transporter ATP-binding protein [Emcibacteraceae bacterium]